MFGSHFSVIDTKNVIIGFNRFHLVQELSPHLTLSDNFQLWNYLWLQRDTVDALTFALVCHVGIDLGCFHVFVSEHVLDGVDACSCINLQGAKGMAGAVEGDVLCNTCRF